MAIVDDSHLGALVNIAGWIVMVSAILITLAKIATKWLLIERLEKDDVVMGIAAAFATAQTLTASIAVGAGLGQPFDTLSANQVHRYEKATLAADVLYVVTVNLAKAAPLIIQSGLCKTKVKTKTLNAILCFIMIWTVIGIFCLAFRCQIPNTWDVVSGKCFDQLAFWTVNAVIDVLTQSSIAIVPWWVLYSLRCSWTTKRQAIFSFAPCALTIPLTILRLVYLYRAASRSDRTMAAYYPALITEIHTNFSILAGCAPFLKPIVEAISVGMISNDIILVSERIQSDIGQRRKGTKTFILLGGRAFNYNEISGPSIMVVAETTEPSPQGEIRDRDSSAAAISTAPRAFLGIDEIRPEEELSEQQSRHPMVIYESKTVDITSVPR